MTNTCICNKCERKALAVPGKRHRRCPGFVTHIVIRKNAKLPKASRGTWEGPALASK